MCTVTFIPTQSGVSITSNRDEKKERLKAFPPAVTTISTGKLVFPKDTDANGTWIAFHERNEALVLLNGAFEAHHPFPPYRKSRGLILLELFEFQSAFEGFQKIDLSNIEPFTLIIWRAKELFEVRWDGISKYETKLNSYSGHIWSSSTLYDATIREKRKKWFDNWLYQHPNPTTDEILSFHEFTGDGDQENDFKMDRRGELFTVSITSMKIDEEKGWMIYKDLKMERNTLSVSSLQVQLLCND